MIQTTLRSIVAQHLANAVSAHEWAELIGHVGRNHPSLRLRRVAERYYQLFEEEREIALEMMRLDQRSRSPARTTQTPYRETRCEP